MIKFKRFMLIFLLLTVSSVFVSSVYGHPPKDIQISFDKISKILKCKIIHSTPDVKKHYIDDIIVSLNNKVIIKQECKQQSSSEAQTVLYTVVDANKDDIINVEADCNVFGSLKKELKVK